MPRREPFDTEELYHITNHAIDDNCLFYDEYEYSRLIESLQVFNRNSNITILEARNDVEVFPEPLGSGNLEQLVEIISFTLMPNHYHLLLRQLVDNGIQRFMTKINVGYANYFNKKNKRKGPLFQHRYRVEKIASQSHYDHITRYIHLNILDLSMIEWREGTLQDWEKAHRELLEYPWSSCRNYLLNEDSSFITKIDNYNDIPNYEKYLKEWAQRNL